EGGSVLLLSGGDINTGVPESDLQDAEPDFRGMNLIGYDAMAVAKITKGLKNVPASVWNVASQRLAATWGEATVIWRRSAPFPPS
ncbi:hypothetical protein MJM43_30335, partial [Salmonella enterica subsp. enterica serovar Montevideo]|nr:hypothetical protein [Salmonella enterica subsp. enterica serovar Montevideo]